MQTQSSNAPLASLAAHWHACQGEIPPPLVGASVTLVDDVARASETSSSSSMHTNSGKVYLFGGRLVTTRRMINDLYILDLATLYWTRYSPPHDENVEEDCPLDTQAPQPRYFHSCDLWDNKLIIFGGMGYEADGSSDLCVLNEIIAFDLATQRWDLHFGRTSSNSSNDNPQARYAHLSSRTGDSLIVIGGQNMTNQYIESIDVFDLEKRQWTLSQGFDKQRGSYRSLAVGTSWVVDEHSEDMASKAGGETSASVLSNIQLLPTSREMDTGKGKEKHPPIYVYTNYNFTDVKREMEVIDVLHEGDNQEGETQIEINEQTMGGASLPPGLRFPMGAILGNHLLISGTYLANTSQTFAVWSLYLPKMTWTRIDVGHALSSGSWNRGMLWAKQGQMLVFGHRDRDLVTDYNHRQTNWDHVLMLDLEAWGITLPPMQTASRASINLGLQKLASSTLGSLSHSLSMGSRAEEHRLAPSLGGQGDFEIICADGLRLGCDRAILERRWPWFASKVQDYRVRALREAQRTLKDASRRLDGQDASLAPRLTPRQLTIREPSPVVLSLLIYFYTQSICTPIQRHPAVLAALLIVSKVYELYDLQIWATHAAHQCLTVDLTLPSDFGKSVSRPLSTSSSSMPSSEPGGSLANLLPIDKHRLAVAIYEAATMCGLEGLQIRALRVVMAIAKWIQRSSIISIQSNGEETPMLNSLSPDAAIGAQSFSPYGDNNNGISSAAQSLRSTSSNTTIASPASHKRLSVENRSRGASLSVPEQGPTGMVRKLSKAERMLGIHSSEVPSFTGSGQNLSKAEKMLGISSGEAAAASSNGGSAGRGGLVNRTSSQSAVPTLQTMTSSNLINLRRPSAPSASLASQHFISSNPHNNNSGSSSSSMLFNNNRSGSIPHPISTEHSMTMGNGTGSRKRFSIFGRPSESHQELLRPTTEDDGEQSPRSADFRQIPNSRQLQRSLSHASATESSLAALRLDEEDASTLSDGNRKRPERGKTMTTRTTSTSSSSYKGKLGAKLPAAEPSSSLTQRELRALYSISP